MDDVSVGLASFSPQSHPHHPTHHIHIIISTSSYPHPPTSFIQTPNSNSNANANHLSLVTDVVYVSCKTIIHFIPTGTGAATGRRPPDLSPPYPALPLLCSLGLSPPLLRLGRSVAPPLPRPHPRPLLLCRPSPSMAHPPLPLRVLLSRQTISLPTLTIIIITLTLIIIIIPTTIIIIIPTTILALLQTLNPLSLHPHPHPHTHGSLPPLSG